MITTYDGFDGGPYGFWGGVLWGFRVEDRLYWGLEYYTLVLFVGFWFPIIAAYT